MATVLILGNCVGWYLDSMVGVQIRTLIWASSQLLVTFTETPCGSKLRTCSRAASHLDPRITKVPPLHKHAKISHAASETSCQHADLVFALSCMEEPTYPYQS